jgi:uncharacterized protein (TIGR02452 family)
VVDVPHQPRGSGAGSDTSVEDGHEQQEGQGAPTLRVLACLDDDTRAETVRGLLDIDRSRAASLGRQAIEILRRDHYALSDGQNVDLTSAMRNAMAGVRSVPPDAALPAPLRRPAFATTVQVVNETSLMAGRRLAERAATPAILNLANGVKPGGGFLDGARAQEETLCRSSGLFPTLDGQAMYEHHRRRDDYESSDWVIVSPNVPVFRDDSGALLQQPWLATFLTAAAPVAYRVGQPRSGELMRSRIHRVLSVAHAYGCTDLVLGAWGCGAFGNDPDLTARDFRSALEAFAGAFVHVVFAITDWSPERRFLGPFCATFGPSG